MSLNPIASVVSQSASLLVDYRDGVAYLTLNRPKQMNALNQALLVEILTELQSIGTRTDIRVVVFCANGVMFCAGHDLKEMRIKNRPADHVELFDLCSKVMQAIINLPQPVIAKVHGGATAAGCQLVAQCDLAIASEHAVFAVSGVNLGLYCSTPSVALTRTVGRKKSFEMLVTGDFVSADVAQKEGLINQVVLASELDNAVIALCDSIKAKPFATVAIGKQLFYQQLDLGIKAAYQLAGQTMAYNMTLPETIEGIDAFLAKRVPRWPQDV